ncbi:uncharacterized protein VTP21DRAFT_7845 [Calcarisporiella thermophila]|uniref:uncharacterized protein n=1 Tax=Calcarisporiella thermophila TaxID=911321 RepID=UPI0037444198
MSTTLSLFWDLASVNKEVREKAAQSLIRSLTTFQKAHLAELGARYNELLKETLSEKKLDELCATDVSYAVKRLIRGLPSSRLGARQGFSLALTELLLQLDFMTAKLVLDMLYKYTAISGGMKGDEERDMLFGRIFGFMSIVEAGLLERPSTSLEDAKCLVEGLLECAESKSYLSETCYHVIASAIPHFKKSSYGEEITQFMTERVLKGVQTPDQLYVAMALKENYKDIDWNSCLQNWKHGDILHPSNLNSLARVLKASPTENVPVASTWKPQIHSAWHRVISVILEANQPKNDEQKKKNKLEVKEPRVSLQDFWRAAVDDVLFDTNASHERKYWGFQLFEYLLPRLPHDQMPLLFTPNFMRCFINNLSSDDRFLNKAARHTMNIIHKVAEENKQVGFILVTQLLGKHGNQNFDRITKTKTVETIVASMDVEGVMSYLKYLMNVFTQQVSDDSEESNESRQRKIELHRQWAIDQMFALVRNPRVPKDETWISTILEFVTVHAFFQISSAPATKQFTKPNPELTAATRHVCRERFYGLLGELSTMPPLSKQRAGPLSRMLNGTMNDGEFWAYAALRKIESLSGMKGLECTVELSDDATETRQNAIFMLEKIRKRAQDEEVTDSKHRGFELLLVHVLLQVWTAEDEATGVLLELEKCYPKVFPEKTSKKTKAKTPKKKAKNAKDEEMEEEPEPIEVLVDILLSFLSKPSVLLRNLAEQVFTVFCEQITKTALDLLVSVVEIKNKNEEDELFESENLSEMMELDEDEEQEESESESEDEEEDEEVDEELRRKVAEALEIEAEAASAKEKEDNEEEELLNDDQMLAFDEKLAEIFKQKKLEKSQKRDAVQSMVHFKNKVLDLLDIFVKKQSANPLVFDLILPLFAVARSTAGEQQQAANKANAILNKLAKAKEYPRQYDEASLFDLLQQLHQIARRGANSAVVSQCSQLSLWVVKVLLFGHDSDDQVEGLSRSEAKRIQEARTRVIDIYKESLTDFMTKHQSRLQPAFFLDFVSRYPQTATPLLDLLFTYAKPNGAVKAYRQVQAFHISRSLLEHLVTRQQQQQGGGEVKKMKSMDSILTGVRDAMLETLAFIASHNEDDKLNTQRLKDILKFAGTATRFTRKVLVSTDKIKSTWEVERLVGILELIVKDARFSASPAIRSLCQQMLDGLGIGVRLSAPVSKSQEEEKKEGKSKKENGSVAGENGKEKKRKRSDKNTSEEKNSKKSKKKTKA